MVASTVSSMLNRTNAFTGYGVEDNSVDTQTIANTKANAEAEANYSSGYDGPQAVLGYQDRRSLHPHRQLCKTKLVRGRVYK